MGWYPIKDNQEYQLSYGSDTLENELCAPWLAGQYERGEFSA